MRDLLFPAAAATVSLAWAALGVAALRERLTKRRVYYSDIR